MALYKCLYYYYYYYSYSSYHLAKIFVCRYPKLKWWQLTLGDKLKVTWRMAWMLQWYRTELQIFQQLLLLPHKTCTTSYSPAGWSLIGQMKTAPNQYLKARYVPYTTKTVNHNNAEVHFNFRHPKCRGIEKQSRQRQTWNLISSTLD